MHLIYCLTNPSFKPTIVSVGITDSIARLKKECADATFLPTPYTILLTKPIYNPNCLSIVYSLLDKFGTHLNGTFFDISPDIVKELFDLMNEEEYLILVQNEIEYSIPRERGVYLEHIYDRLIVAHNDIDL